MTPEAPMDAPGWLAEGERLLAARSLHEAEISFRNAEAAGADVDRCAAARWMTAMLGGHFEAAWQESHAIRDRGTPDLHRLWQGESLTGKRIIVRCLHGFGDAVQFLRYLPRLQALAAHLIIEVPPRFVELAHCFRGIGEVITWGEDAPATSPAWDVQIEAMELPYLFHTQLHELPIATNYLRLPRPEPRHDSSSNHLRVGLMWTAGSWNSVRAIPFLLLRPILAVEGCEFWSLQHEEDHCKETIGAYSLRQDQQCRESLPGLADLINRLDLVITVDTLAAHLAGALGVETWLLLQYEADWRWMHGRDDSPWYPSLRLFRQPATGDWNSVITSVCRQLRARVPLTSRERAA
jgi:hypothetical protein